MPSIRPVSAPPVRAEEGARLLMRVFDQARTEKRFDDEKTIPPDGVLQRDEFPSARFGAIDRLEKADGGIDEAELAAALARLSAADQQLVVEEAHASTRAFEGKAKRFGLAFGGFALGGLGIVAGCLLGGPVGVGAFAIGAGSVLFGFGSAVATIVGAGKEGKRLFDVVDAALGRAGL